MCALLTENHLYQATYLMLPSAFNENTANLATAVNQKL
jgi:hypothetical protein